MKETQRNADYMRGYQAALRRKPGCNVEVELELARMRLVAQELWLRLSTMQGWARLVKKHLPREDTIPANTAALEAGREIGLGD